MRQTNVETSPYNSILKSRAVFEHYIHVPEMLKSYIFSKVHITEATLHQLHNEFAVEVNPEGGDDYIKQHNFRTYFIDDSVVNIIHLQSIRV